MSTPTLLQAIDDLEAEIRYLESQLATRSQTQQSKRKRPLSQTKEELLWLNTQAFATKAGAREYEQQLEAQLVPHPILRDATAQTRHLQQLAQFTQVTLTGVHQSPVVSSVGLTRRFTLTGHAQTQHFSVTFSTTAKCLSVQQLRIHLQSDLSQDLAVLMRECERTNNLMGFFRALRLSSQLSATRQRTFQQMFERYSGTPLTIIVPGFATVPVRRTLTISLLGNASVLELGTPCLKLMLTWDIVVVDKAGHIKSEISLFPLAQQEYAALDYAHALTRIPDLFHAIVNARGVIEAVDYIVSNLLGIRINKLP
ncbi:hypothetical protein H4R34_000484 [Dimargaris verticillata]|uniref:Uncharacterized protein n=1 Tax=Dimargaris verticillata TaxID=2761393 RepID=A0A9W8B663_9FUNG|nr:hypothetical protein H4R34_000484 [Dimargaris verticillata]